MTAGQLFQFIDQVPSPWNQVIKALLAVGGFVYVFFKTFKYVPEGNKALRLKFQTVVHKEGKPVVLDKGLHIMFPFVHNLKIVSVLDRTIDLKDIALRRETYVVHNVRATIVLRVVDIYRVTYVAQDFVDRMTAACEHALRLALPEGWQATGQLDVLAVTESFQGEIDTAASELGVEFGDLNITNVSPNAMVLVAGAIDRLGAPAALAQFGVTTSINGSSKL